MPVPKPLHHSPYLPYDEGVQMYNTAWGHLTPWEFSDWKAETLSWKEGVYFHAGLNPNLRNVITGPDALRMFKETCINSFEKFSVGASKHGVMCNDCGNTMADGLIWRTGEEEYVNMGHGPYVDYLAQSGRYDIKVDNRDGKTFLFQIAGPHSLAVMEALTGESLRDIEFFWHRPSAVPQEAWLKRDIKVRIYCVGVARTLAYEVHGEIDDAEAVYEAILKAGEPYGIKRLGLQAYGMNHTEGGFAQSFIHFLHAWTEDQAFMDYIGDQYSSILEVLPGSAGDDITKRYANPYELGLGQMVKFDHDFTGRSALEAVAASNHRRIVTLEWDDTDVLAVQAAQFSPKSRVQSMDPVTNQVWQGYMSRTFCDDVLVGDRIVGMSSGRMMSHYYGKMISLAIVDADVAAQGSVMEVLWGDPGTDQMRISARSSRFPYIDLPHNNNIDVHSI
ncbi:aminomethyltransferase family protein [Sphingomonas sp. Leaf20]|uniref:aminomethyltransferase family protein n=1 Tax=Sphingomonas sp. Leaf20 TaxID=1735685 RepID=UPI0006FB0FC2|nr:aminomethyltransferase family protein [Sphingomonas sp. Leaf20]KQM68896.1 aminomethyltransferase [Sphingomonas sp. Leaf20]